MLLLNEQDIPLFSMDNIIIATVDTIDLDFCENVCAHNSASLHNIHWTKIEISYKFCFQNVTFPCISYT